MTQYTYNEIPIREFWIGSREMRILQKERQIKFLGRKKSREILNMTKYLSRPYV